MRFFFKIVFYTFRNWMFTLFLISFVLTTSSNKSIVCCLKNMYKSRSFSRSSIWNIMNRTSREFLTIVSKFEYLLYVAIQLRSDYNDEKYYCKLNCVSNNDVLNKSILNFQKFFSFFSMQWNLERVVFQIMNRRRNSTMQRAMREQFSLIDKWRKIW